MSCRILIDSINNPGITLSNNPCQSSDKYNSFKRNLSHANRTNIFTFLSRAIFSRRLRLLKVYMALGATLVVLIFLFGFISNKPDLTNASEDKQHELLKSHELPKYKYKLNSQSFNQLEDVEIRLPNLQKNLDSNENNDKSSTQYPLSKVANHNQNYLYNNFTYTLNGADFKQMKNVNLMQVRIREAAKHSWDNYRKYAWGFDMLKPRSREPDHWFNLGLTIVDAADTLIIMGLEHDANLALDWMDHELKFNSENANSNCFEMTIRILAGLLSAYHLSGRDKIKQQAIEFGDILLHCYDTESRIIPYSDIDLGTRRAHPPPWNPHSSLSEVASLQLEFRFLSQISSDPKYEQTSFRTSVHIHEITAKRKYKLLPMYINPTTGELEDSVITMGARTDSYYEYLLKQYLQTGIKWLVEDYLDSMDEVASRLIRHTDGSENYTYVAELQAYRTINDTEDFKYLNKMDHLVCFLPGTLILGHYHYSPQASEYRLKYNLETPSDRLNSRFDSHLNLAKDLARTCLHMYSSTGTGLSPEIATFVHSATNDPVDQNQPEIQIQPTSAYNILRPEFVESLFYLYHVTGLPMYRNQAAQVFEAFEKYSRIATGYSAVSDVRQRPLNNVDIDETLHRNAPDRMESFWLSETLKYLYLIFCDDKQIVGTILNNYVFNTEGHLFPIK